MKEQKRILYIKMTNEKESYSEIKIVKNEKKMKNIN